MKKSRFTDSQIIAVLKQAEAGTPVPELCREHGISSATFYKWRSKFGGMDASMMAQAQGAGGREPAPEEDVRRGADERRDPEGGPRKKMVRPSQRREMARWAVENKGREHPAGLRRLSASARPAIATSRSCRTRTR